MKLKKCFVLILSIVLLISIINTTSLASVEEVISAMEGVNTPAENSKVQGVMNTVIGLIQIAGTGIALVMVTILGIKYLMASPGEKADVKKQIMPMLIGCVLLFGAVTLMSAVYEFSQTVLGE